MSRRLTQTAIPWLFLAAFAACAAPRAMAPSPAPPTAAPDSRLPPPAEELESFPLVRDEPAVASVTAALAAATPDARPAALLRRAREAFAAARRIFTQKGYPLKVSGWSPERERFIAFCELALRDLDEILVAHPGSLEAPEAMFNVGRINDYPNLNEFDKALEAYKMTVERYPYTIWAQQAAERVRLLEEIFDAGQDSPHRITAPPQDPAR